MSTDQLREISDLVAKKFIARPDVKAVQNQDGSWRPHTHNGKVDGDRLKWGRQDIISHVNGDATYGHYMLSTTDQVKLFAFDIDLEKNQPDPNKPRPFQGYWVDDNDEVHEYDARAAWLDRSHPSRTFNKMQLKMIATQLMARITEELDIHCAAAYTGGKGVHVYGFTGLCAASDAREGAMIVLESLGGWEATRGENFFKTTDQDPKALYRNLSIELFPKQNSLEGKDLGNLMRLPLGRNLKNKKDPTFFIDMTSPMGQLVPSDPIRALTTSPWKTADE